jgi:hypothetical protein
MNKITKSTLVLTVLQMASLAALFAADTAQAMDTTSQVHANGVVEWSVTSTKEVRDPFNEIDLYFVVTAPDGRTVRVPGFWAGGQTWRGRYSSATIGIHRFRTECSDVGNVGLHGATGQVEITPYMGDNLLLRHGALRVAGDHRHFAYADGTPFLWLGDTWWMGLCARLGWPNDFQTLAADRKQKGFNVIQIVAGLYPDMPAFDARGANEAGFPWEKDYSHIRPEYFDAADRRIRYLVEQGFVPCVVGAWGYHLPWLGTEKMKQHWRYLVARWGAFPVVWCAAGEGTMPFYLSKNRDADSAMQKTGWTDVIRSIRAIDPFHRLVTIHPPLRARDTVADANVLDFDMHQSGHGSPAAQHGALALGAYRSAPVMPVVSGEARYEALVIGRILDASDARQAFWAHLINSGCAGHTYGANGIWQVNRRGQPYGASPGGNNWGTTPWDDAMRLPGSSQLAAAKRLLETLPWSRLEPHPQWAAVAASDPSAKTPIRFDGAQWIWYPEGNPAEDAPVAKRFFRRQFELPAENRIVSARLRVSCDDHCKVWLNGDALGEHADWKTGRQFSGMEKKLRAGHNTLSIEAENRPAPVTKNPAGLIVRFNVEFADNTALCVDSDTLWRVAKTVPGNWRVADFDTHDWATAKLLGAYGCGPWGKLTDPENTAISFCAGISNELRLVYLLAPSAIEVRALKARASYNAQWFDPVTGLRQPALTLDTDAQGSTLARPPSDEPHDWVLVVKLAGP